MEPATIKNILQNVIHFLEHDKYFELRDEPENRLDQFLIELNRFRELAGLDRMVLDKVIPVPSGGQKCRFSVSCSEKDSDELEAKTAEPEKVMFSKVTKTAFTALIVECLGSDVTAAASREGGITQTAYHLDDRLVGVWSRARGWHYTK